jgi:tetratricopeptide (TPR) repeat protein
MLNTVLPYAALAVLLLSTATHAQTDTLAKERAALPKSIPAGSSLPTSSAQRQAMTATFTQSIEAARQGNAAEKVGDWKTAAKDYHQALGVWPGNTKALYGLARCAKAAGDTASALAYYRQAIYANRPVPFGRVIQEPYAFHSMPFILLLNETGQTQEAVSDYNEMVRRMEYDPVNGSQMLKVLLPQFGDGPGQEPYSPQEFEAMAHLAFFVDAFGYEGYGDPEPLTHLQKALALAPDSAVANYYMGKYLCGKNDPGAKAYLQKAVDLGDDQTAAAAKVYLNILR